MEDTEEREQGRGLAALDQSCESSHNAYGHYQSKSLIAAAPISFDPEGTDYRLGTGMLHPLPNQMGTNTHSFLHKIETIATHPPTQTYTHTNTRTHTHTHIHIHIGQLENRACHVHQWIFLETLICIVSVQYHLSTQTFGPDTFSLINIFNNNIF